MAKGIWNTELLESLCNMLGISVEDARHVARVDFSIGPGLEVTSTVHMYPDTDKLKALMAKVAETGAHVTAAFVPVEGKH